MEKKYLLLVYCECKVHNFFFEIEDDLEWAKALAQQAKTSIGEFPGPRGITKVKLLDVSNNKEIEY